MQTRQFCFDGFHGLSRLFLLCVAARQHIVVLLRLARGGESAPAVAQWQRARVSPGAVGRRVGGQVTLGYDVRAQGTVVSIKVVAS